MPVTKHSGTLVRKSHVGNWVLASVKLTSLLLSGVYYLPFALAIIPFAGGSGWILSKCGKYVPLHYAGTALLAIGTGLFATLDTSSSRAAWIGLQIIPSAGIAMIYTVIMSSTLAPLREADMAVATATYSFVGSFGFVLGVTMGGIVFNGQVNARLDLVHDETWRESLRNGAAYAFAGTAHQLKGRIDMSEVVQVYANALRVVWFVVMAVALLSFVLVPVERSIKLRKGHDADFDVREKKVKKENVVTLDARGNRDDASSPVEGTEGFD
ncbi:hypothetical protein J1614_006186 [Plenodomus biglobosus]|nr:hypothetical protein J1614_006186 [Plenodomus biglobosus]